MQELSQNSGSDISRHTSLADQCKQKLELFFFCFYKIIPRVWLVCANTTSHIHYFFVVGLETTAF